MKQFYVIKSTKKRQHGHSCHLMLLKNNELVEISPKTGGNLSSCNKLIIKFDDVLANYEFVKPSTAEFAYNINYKFYNYLMMKGMIYDELCTINAI